MSAETEEQLACPICNKKDQLQQRCTVDVYYKGELYDSGEFDVNDSYGYEEVWETLEYTDDYYCLNCEEMLTIKVDPETGTVSLEKKGK